MTTRYDHIYRKASRLYGVPFELLKEQGRAESGFNPKARSRAGALGIAQFMEKTGRAYGLYTDADRMNPDKAIDAQARHMKDLYGRHGDWGTALAAYNMGSGRLEKRGVETVFSPSGTKKWETANYTRKILRRSGIKSSEIPLEGGKMASNYDDILKQLRAQRAALQQQFDAESDLISEYEMGAEGAYDAANESPDLALMRELAQRASSAQENAPMSNVAAQYSMLLDPNFAKVFEDATSKRVNAARQHFANIGTIARQAQSERQARASSRRRSDFRGRALGQRILEYDRQIGALEKQRREDEAKIDQIRKRAQLKPAPKGPKPETTKLDGAINNAMAREQKLLSLIHGDQKERIMVQMGLKQFAAMLGEAIDTNGRPLSERAQSELLRERLNKEALLLLRDQSKWNYTDSDIANARKQVLKNHGLTKDSPGNKGGANDLVPQVNPQDQGVPINLTPGGRYGNAQGLLNRLRR